MQGVHASLTKSWLVTKNDITPITGGITRIELLAQESLRDVGVNI